MASLKERTLRIVNHHATEAAKAAALKQEWQKRMKYEIGREILRDEKYIHVTSYFEEFPDRGWDPDWGWEEADQLYKKMEEDKPLVNLAKELNIRNETLIDSILFAVYIAREYGSFEKYLEEVSEVWFHSELGRLKPRTPAEEEDHDDQY